MAAGPIKEPPAFEPRTYQILIKPDNRFDPENLKIEKGSIVEWRISNGCSSDQEDDLDSYLTKSHVIAFESPELQHTESQVLRGEKTSFKVRFLEPGLYPYRCQIFPRMRGVVSVFENVHQLLSHTQVPLRPQTAVIGLGPSKLF